MYHIKSNIKMHTVLIFVLYLRVCVYFYKIILTKGVFSTSPVYIKFYPKYKLQQDRTLFEST